MRSIPCRRVIATILCVLMLLATFAISGSAQTRRRHRHHHSKRRGAIVGGLVGAGGGALVGSRRGAAIGAGFLEEDGGDIDLKPRKSNNRLTTDGVRAEFAVTSDADEIIARLPEIAAVSRARDHAGGRSSLLDDDTGMQRWIQRLIGLARLCHLELSTLLLDGEPAAYVLGIEDNGAYRVLEGRYVTTWKRYAPGRLLEAHVLERVLDRSDLHELDWMTSAAPDTLLAANGAVDVVTVDIVL